MKTYLINLSSRLYKFAKKINAESILSNKAWVVLKDDGVKETYIFKNSNIIISRDGNATMGKYEILLENKILISIDGQNYLINPLFSDTVDLVAFQLDGKNEYSFLINEGCDLYQQIRTYSSLISYIDDQERLIIEQKRQKDIEQERLLMEKHKMRYLRDLELDTLRYCYRRQFYLKLFVVLLPLLVVDISIEFLLYNNNLAKGYVSLIAMIISIFYWYYSYQTYLVKSALQYIDELLYKLPSDSIKRVWLKDHREAITKDSSNIFKPNNY